MYSLDTMNERLGKPINRAGKHSEYTKLFRIDGDLSLSKWKSLVTHYFQDNPLLYEYFGMKTEYDSLIKETLPQDENSVLKKLVPYLVTNENGVRLFVSYHKPHEGEAAERKIICMDNVLLQNGERYPSMEFNAIEILKALKRLGHEMEIPPETVFIKATDDFINFPTILHTSKNLEDCIATTLSAYVTLLTTMETIANRAVVFTLAWQMEGREVRLSVYGMLHETNRWLSKNQEIPVDHNKFRDWLEDQKKWLSENYEAQHNHPDLYNLVKRDGVIYIQRNVVDDAWVEFEETDVGLQHTITIPKGMDELSNALSEGTLHTSISYIVKEASCSKTDQNYFTSLTSKILDPDVVAIIKKVSSPTVVWTRKIS